MVDVENDVSDVEMMYKRMAEIEHDLILLTSMTGTHNSSAELQRAIKKRRWELDNLAAEVIILGGR